MRTINLNTWQEFQEGLAALEVSLAKRRSESGLSVSRPMFRGHADHSWELETTLERYGVQEISIQDYFHLIFNARHYVESFTGRRWDIPSLDQHKQYLEEHDTLMIPTYPAYDYMIYLRHHGFPSPLLDWTYSPYVAAFFAFDGAARSPKFERVAILAFCDRYGHGRFTTSARPEIQVRGPYVTTHPRHFRQQSVYTNCILRKEEWGYCPHEVIFRDQKEEADQDMLWKFTLPVGERRQVLGYLERHNVNACSLFDSEESLMSTIATRELFLKAPLEY